MAIGRIPGPLGDAIGSKAVSGRAVLGRTATATRPVPKGVEHKILFPPPGLFQRELYKGEEGLFACWATAAEMVVKHRSPNARFVRPVFEHLIPSGEPGSDAQFQSRLRYMDFVDGQLEQWGFTPLPGGTSYPWDTATLASWLNQRGPLLCHGDFFRIAPSDSAFIHCIAVFGGQDDVVYFRDPADDDKRVHTMSIGTFLTRARPKLRNPWALGTDRHDLPAVHTA